MLPVMIPIKLHVFAQFVGKQQLTGGRVKTCKLVSCLKKF